MFKKEKKDNDRYCKYMEEHKKQRDEAVNVKDSLIAKRDDLQLEVERKIRLARVTQAANLAMKGKLEDANRSINKLELDKMAQVEKMKSMELDTREMHNRHDDMFEQTSALNARIEELESHKLLLLEKLKALGDKSGLEYIIKTQKLDNV